jgi:hypothetical protein
MKIPSQRCQPRRLASILLVALAGLTSVSAFASDDIADDPWIGLWRLNSGLEHTAALHVVVSRREGVYQASHYSQAFERRYDFDRLVIRGDSLYAEARGTSKPFVVELKTSSPGMASGVWKLVHPQFRTEIPMKGVRINGVNHWNAAELAKPRESGPLLNLFDVLSKAPLDSQSGFERFWDEEVEARYYPLVQDVVYAPHLGRESRMEKLRRLRERLNPEYFERARKLGEVFKEVGLELEEKAKALSRKNVVVICPLVGSEGPAPLVLDDGLLVRISPDLPDSRHRGIVARMLLELPFYQQYPPQLKLIVATAVRSGLAVHLAVANGFASGPEETFATWAAEKVDQPLGELALQVRRSLRDPMLASRLPREALVTVGVAFARQLCESYSPAELVALSQEKLSALFLDYLAGFKDRPQAEAPSAN